MVNIWRSPSLGLNDSSFVVDKCDEHIVKKQRAVFRAWGMARLHIRGTCRNTRLILYIVTAKCWDLFNCATIDLHLHV